MVPVRLGFEVHLKKKCHSVLIGCSKITINPSSVKLALVQPEERVKGSNIIVDQAIPLLSSKLESPHNEVDRVLRSKRGHKQFIPTHTAS